jgi:glyoxylase-like metal-dependent hydrolase (beta-lactamase superfamily II)
VKIVIGALAAGAAVLVGSLVVTVRGTAPIREDVALEGVQVVKDGFVAVYLVDLGPGAVALVDAGNDGSGRPILDALARRGLGPDAVKAILLTHGDSDHVAAAHLFPGATVMALGAEVARVEGREGRGPWHLFPAMAPGLRVGRVLRDGETVDLDGVGVRVYELPGHTPGSAAFLARGVLFLGDSAAVTTAGALVHGWWFSNADTALEERSLRALAARLRPLAGEIRAIAPAHATTLVSGFAPLAPFAQRP